MKNILYVLKDFFPWEVRAAKFCNSLSLSGFNVLLLCRYKEGQIREENTGAFSVRRIGFNQPHWKSIPSSFNPNWRKEIESAITQFKPDLLIAREFHIAEAVADKAHKYNLPVIMDMADHYPAAMKGWNKYNKTVLRRLIVQYLKIPELIERRAVLKMDGIITHCDELSERLERDFSFKRENITEVYNTPDLNWYESVKKGVNNPPVNFAYHGYLSTDRNLDVMVKGFLLALEKNPGINMFLAGDGENMSQLIEIVKNSKFPENIKLYGSYEQEKLKDFLSVMDIGILPYKNNEFINHIISNKLFDYMACGKPIIVSEAKPMVRIINETGCGISADCSNPENMAEAILRIATLNNLEMSAKGIESSKEKYNWQNDSEKLVSFVNKYL